MSRLPSLRERTTLRVGGRARLEAVAATVADLDGLTHVLEREGARPLCLGRGSNLLAAEGELDIALIRLQACRNAEIVREDDRTAVIRVGGGENLPWLLGWCGRQGFSGMESLAGIPGSVGGAVAMNAGSYGRSISDVLHRIQVWSGQDGLRWLEQDDWSAGYRSFGIGLEQEFWMVAAAELLLEKDSRESVRQRMIETYQRKKQTQPVLAWTCGCAFKNPAGERPAWRLLKESGMCDLRVGGMRFSQQHCNFLVNSGKGTGSQALELLDRAENRVMDRFGIELELEVKVLT